MDLYLIRHAQSENNAVPESQRVEDPDITEIGERQAAQLAEWIPTLELTVLISSPFLRTLRTTEHLARATGLRPKVRSDLHELGGCMRGPTPAVMEGRPGMTRSEINAAFPEFQVHEEIGEDGWWQSRPYESSQQANHRAERLLQATRDEYADTDHRVAYVMHGDFKRIFINRFHDEPFVSPWNTSISCVRIRSDGAELLRFNQVDHLHDELLTR